MALLKIDDITLTLLVRLEDTARYTGLLLSPVEGFGLGLYYAVLAKFRPFLISSSNLSNLKNNPESQ